ncbi:MAG: DUF1634 domain-containing protein [Phycisphaerae bacterium]|nr:DUF1634 domain-containing protein [Phycisphaerae bacterium]
MNSDADRAARHVELLISNLLRFGVLASLLLVIAGTIVSFVKHPEYIHSHAVLAPLTSDRAAFPKSLADSVHDFGLSPGRSLIVIGLLLLVATPVMRVAVSVLAFLYERDFAFTIITLVVLSLLIISFVIGKSTGG